VLGEQRNASSIQRPGDPSMDSAQPVDRGKQAECAAASGEEQFPIRRRNLC